MTKGKTPNPVSRATIERVVVERSTFDEMPAAKNGSNNGPSKWQVLYDALDGMIEDGFEGPLVFKYWPTKQVAEACQGAVHNKNAKIREQHGDDFEWQFATRTKHVARKGYAVYVFKA